MSRTEIKVFGAVGHDSDGRYMAMLEASPEIDGAGLPSLFDGDATDDVFGEYHQQGEVAAGTVQAVGSLLFGRFHDTPGAEQGLAGDKAVFLRTRVNLPWETLYHPEEGFLALGPGVSRIPELADDSARRELSGKLRVVAILAADQRDPKAQFDALNHGISQLSLECTRTCLVAEEAQKAIVDDTWDCEVIPDTRELLVHRLKELRPQILHVFCHGNSSQRGHLEFAHRGSSLGADPLFFEARDFKELSGELWLLVLAACQTAMSNGKDPGLAHDIVEKGAAATIGMRETIDQQDADAFSRALYQELPAYLNEAFADGAGAEIRWDSLLPRIRSALCTGGPTTVVAPNQKRWTLPILYVQARPLTVSLTAEAADFDVGRLAQLLDILRQHDDQISDELRAKIEAEVERLKDHIGI